MAVFTRARPWTGMAHGGSALPVIAAIAANLGIAVAKFIAAAFTGSSAMISEGIHSLVDTGDGVLLLIGMRLSRRPPDDEHPFGHGKEVYVWSMVVSVLIFALGAGMSVYEGIVHLRHPTELKSTGWSFGVLGIAAVFEGISWGIALRRLLRRRRGRSLTETISQTRDPSLVAVFLEDSAALTGLAIAAAGMGLTLGTGNAVWDGISSILIGLVLALIASVLAKISRDLLVGQAADRDTVESIRRLAQSSPGVKGVRPPLTMHLGPDEILLNLSVEFSASVTIEGLPGMIARLERRIRREHPRIKRIFVEAESLSGRATARAEQERGEPEQGEPAQEEQEHDPEPPTSAP